MHYMPNEYNKFTERLIFSVCFLSVLSQLPLKGTFIYNVATLAWAVFFIYIMRINKSNIPLSSILILPIGFIIYAVVISLIVNNNILSGPFIKYISMDMIIFVIGMMVGAYFNDKIFVAISKGYVISTFLVSVYVWFKYVRGRTMIANGYLYGPKNSLACIVLIGLVITVIMKDELFKSYTGKKIYLILVAYDIYFLFCMKSRTTLVCFAVLTAMYILFSDIKLSRKLMLTCLIVAAIIFVMNNERAYDLIVNNILLKGKEADDFDGITSNRITHFEIFKRYFPVHRWVGFGDFWVESFPLYSLISFGILGSTFLFGFVLMPLVVGIVCLIRTQYKKMSIILIATSVLLTINGLGEAATPPGPGVKCFLMWFLAGICNYVMLYGKNSNGEEDGFVNKVEIEGVQT